MEYRSSKLLNNPKGLLRKHWIDYYNIRESSKTYIELKERVSQYRIENGYFDEGWNSDLMSISPFAYFEDRHFFDDKAIVIHNHVFAELLRRVEDFPFSEFLKFHNKGLEYFNTYYNKIDPSKEHLKKVHTLYQTTVKSTLQTSIFYYKDHEYIVKDYAHNNGIVSGYIEYEKVNIEFLKSIIQELYDDNKLDELNSNAHLHPNIFRNNGFVFWEMLIDSFGLMQGVNHPAIVNFIYDQMQFDYIHSDTIHKAAFFRWIKDVYSENHPEVEALQNTSYKPEQYSKTYQLTFEKFKNLPEKGK